MNKSLFRFNQFRCMLKWSPTSDDALLRAESRLFRNFQFQRVSVPVFDNHGYIHTIVKGPALQHLSSDQPTHDELRKALARDDQPPICLVHGFGAGAGFWFKNIDELQQKTGRNVLAIDVIGNGASSRKRFAHDATKSLVEQAEETENYYIEAFKQWQDELELEKINLIGHSLGGFISAGYGFKYPERLERLILASPVGVPEKSVEDEAIAARRRESSFMYRSFTKAWSSGVTPQKIVRISGRYGQKLVQKYVYRRFPAMTEMEKRNLSDYLYHISAAQPSGENALSLLLSPGAWAIRPLAPRFNQMSKDLPCLFLYGTHDWMTPSAAQNICLTNNDNWKFRFVENAGHQLFIENPPLFNEISSQFINNKLTERQIIKRKIKIKKRKETNNNDNNNNNEDEDGFEILQI